MFMGQSSSVFDHIMAELLQMQNLSLDCRSIVPFQTYLQLSQADVEYIAQFLVLLAWQI